MGNQVLFYVGIILAVLSIIAGIIYFCIAKIKMIKLNVQLESEYGKKQTFKNKNK